MDHFQHFTTQLRNRLTVMLFVENAVIIGDWWLAEHVFHLNGYEMLIALVAGSILGLTIFPWLSTQVLAQPTRLIWQAILHIAPDAGNIPAPDLKHLRLGREMVASLIAHVYQLASVVENVENLKGKSKPDFNQEFVPQNLPLPLVILDTQQNIAFANRAMGDYLERAPQDIIGQNVYSVLDLSFPSEHTLDSWLNYVKTRKPTASKSWERVKLVLPDSRATRLFDMAAYYNQSNPQGLETMLVMFDRTRQYNQDEQAMSFVALAVHELRTPLTLLRGYIEVFKEELTGKVTPELQDCMRKMEVAAQQQAAFINNILNVSKYENDQFYLSLHEESWSDILTSAINDMRLRAEVQGITLTTDIAESLPTVGADRVSMYEVIANLIDNAIKYSADSKQINIRSYLNKEGMVETTVQDFGVGIQEAAIPNLFDKFYRNHRNRAQVGGTGMGLYLSKAIITAHGGLIWVNAKEGQGSTFGFSLQPFSQLAEEQKNSDNKDIVRSPHGWIKNHSLYRR